MTEKKAILRFVRGLADTQIKSLSARLAPAAAAVHGGPQRAPEFRPATAGGDSPARPPRPGAALASVGRGPGLAHGSESPVPVSAAARGDSSELPGESEG